MKRVISPSIVAFTLLGIVLGIGVMFYFDPASWVDETRNVFMVASALLSVLAGFLMATIVMQGDDKNLHDGGWKVASAHARQIRINVVRLVALFYVYLFAVVFILLAMLITTLESGSDKWGWVGRGAAGLSCMALFWSLCLPRILYKTLMERINRAVDGRKIDENVTTDER